MAHDDEPQIRRNANGTIDFDFYDRRARALRAQAIVGSPPQMLVPVWRRIRAAGDALVVAMASAVIFLMALLRAVVGKSTARPETRG